MTQSTDQPKQSKMTEEEYRTQTLKHIDDWQKYFVEFLMAQIGADLRVGEADRKVKSFQSISTVAAIIQDISKLTPVTPENFSGIQTALLKAGADMMLAPIFLVAGADSSEFHKLMNDSLARLKMAQSWLKGELALPPPQILEGFPFPSKG